jgi:hypothetical protein
MTAAATRATAAAGTDIDVRKPVGVRIMRAPAGCLGNWQILAFAAAAPTEWPPMATPAIEGCPGEASSSAKW